MEKFKSYFGFINVKNLKDKKEKEAKNLLVFALQPIMINCSDQDWSVVWLSWNLMWMFDSLCFILNGEDLYWSFGRRDIEPEINPLFWCNISFVLYNSCFSFSDIVWLIVVGKCFWFIWRETWLCIILGDSQRLIGMIYSSSWIEEIFSWDKYCVHSWLDLVSIVLMLYLFWGISKILSVDWVRDLAVTV